HRQPRWRAGVVCVGVLRRCLMPRLPYRRRSWLRDFNTSPPEPTTNLVVQLKMGGPGYCNASRSPHLLHFLLLTMMLASNGAVGVKIIEVKVPRRAEIHTDVRLECHFDLEGADLYSLTWWRGPDQFYQYSPSQVDKLVVHNSSGILVDV
ncbi:unnamed protein product, partial [Meganyctiphanes norvegica]